MINTTFNGKQEPCEHVCFRCPSFYFNYSDLIKPAGDKEHRVIQQINYSFKRFIFNSLVREKKIFLLFKDSFTVVIILCNIR